MKQKIENTEGFKRDRRREILTVHGIEPGPSRVQGNLTDHCATRPSGVGQGGTLQDGSSGTGGNQGQETKELEKKRGS